MKNVLNLGVWSLLLTLSLSVCQYAVAGGDISGGGDSLICDRPFFQGLKDLDFSDYVYLADTAEELRYSSNWDSVAQMGRDDLLAIALATIEEDDSRLSAKIRQALSSFEWKFVSELEELDDDNLTLIPTGCHKKQLAIQDIASGQIRVNSKLYHRLSHLEQALLQIHEAYIHFQTPEEIRIRNTEKIRERVSDLLTSVDFSEKLSRAAWCWSNPAHAYTAIFFHQKMTRTQKAGDWFKRAETLPVGRIIPVGLDFNSELMVSHGLAAELEMFMLAQGATIEPGITLAGEVGSALESRNQVTVSEMAHIVDSAFRFPGELSKKQSCVNR